MTTVLEHMGVVITIPDESKPEATLQLEDERFDVRMPDGTGYEQVKLYAERCAQTLVQLTGQIAGAESRVAQAEASLEEVQRQARLKCRQAESARETLTAHLAELTEGWASP